MRVIIEFQDFNKFIDPWVVYIDGTNYTDRHIIRFNKLGLAIDYAKSLNPEQISLNFSESFQADLL